MRVGYEKFAILIQ